MRNETPYEKDVEDGIVGQFTPIGEESPKKTLNNEVISLNIGGQTFRCRASTLRTRCPESKLARFAQNIHEARLIMCDAYFQSSNEYYFERSAKLFETIYKFHVTGALHRPLDVCEVEFFAELAFWRIPETLVAQCCWSRFKQLSESLDDLTLNKKNGSGEEEPLSARLYRFTEGDGSFGSTIFTFISICFVLISVLGLVMGSIQDFQVPIHKTGNSSKRFSKDESINRKGKDSNIIWEPHPFFNYLETVCIIWFTIEYVLRFVCAPKKLPFFFGLLNLVDLVAIVPFLLELFLAIIGIDATSISDIKGAFLVIRILRVMRVVRILKLGRYSSGMRTFALTLRSSAKQLGMMGMVLFTGVVFFSTLLYFVEKDEENTPFTSIPAAFWWAIVTMSTVGYGDYVPVTIPGKLIASGAIISGVLVLALPITIIVDNFMKVSGSVHPGAWGPNSAAAAAAANANHHDAMSPKKSVANSNHTYH
uniref:BTB domain-containing protein n=1 Tax=Acrobeloides nanus TaxID=290746 RepID=A0A914DSX1_9BILA